MRVTAVEAPRAGERAPRPRPAASATAIAIALVAVAAIATPIRFGWEALAPDDATYLYVGRTVLDGGLPTDPLGSFYASRSPLFPVVLAATDLAGRTALVGPHLAVWAIGLAGLVGAVLVARRLGGGPAALGTAAALAATPAVWMITPTLRIDLPLTAGVVATIAALLRPTGRRWLLAGLLAGASILLKETAALLVLLPVAWWGALDARRWATLTARYVAGATAVAAWWWVLVWVRIGDIAPLAGAQRVAAERFSRPAMFDGAAWALVGLLAAGWVAFAIARRADPRSRTLVVAAAALAVPAAFAWRENLALRQLVPLAVLSCIALGTVAGSLVARGLEAGGRRRLATLATCAVLGVTIGVTQVRTEPLHRRPGITETVAEWLRPRLEPDAVVAMNRLSRSELAYRLYDEASVDVARFRLSDAPPAADDDLVWLGIYDGRFHSLARAELRRVVTRPDVRHLVWSAPHRTAPAELLDALSAGGVEGIELAATFVADGQEVLVLAVDPARAGAGVDALPAMVTPTARDRLGP